MYSHDGNRGAANWKGGASYFTVSSAVPVYHWSDNNPVNILYSTIKHWLQRSVWYTGYCKEVQEDPNWNKSRLSFTGLVREPRTIWLFTQNTLLAIKDLFIQPFMSRIFSAPGDTTAAVSARHAALSHQIVDKMSLPKPVIIRNTSRTKAVRLHTGGLAGLEQTNTVLTKLNDVCGDIVHSKRLTPSELTERGYDNSFVKQVQFNYNLHVNLTYHFRVLSFHTMAMSHRM